MPRPSVAASETAVATLRASTAVQRLSSGYGVGKAEAGPGPGTTRPGRHRIERTLPRPADRYERRSGDDGSCGQADRRHGVRWSSRLRARPRPENLPRSQRGHVRDANATAHCPPVVTGRGPVERGRARGRLAAVRIAAARRTLGDSQPDPSRIRSRPTAGPMVPPRPATARDGRGCGAPWGPSTHSGVPRPLCSRSGEGSRGVVGIVACSKGRSPTSGGGGSTKRRVCGGGGASHVPVAAGVEMVMRAQGRPRRSFAKAALVRVTWISRSAAVPCEPAATAKKPKILDSRGENARIGRRHRWKNRARREGLRDPCARTELPGDLRPWSDRNRAIRYYRWAARYGDGRRLPGCKGSAARHPSSPEPLPRTACAMP